MLIFEKITQDTLPNALEIVNSNPDYNILENGNPLRTIEEIQGEFLNSETDSFLIKNNDDYIGLIDFLHKNPKDGFPWIGLLMIHGEFHSQGYGTKVYYAFESKLKDLNMNNVRLGVLQNNVNAIEFWTRQGFTFYETKNWRDKKIDCFEKQINV